MQLLCPSRSASPVTCSLGRPNAHRCVLGPCRLLCASAQCPVCHKGGHLLFLPEVKLQPCPKMQAMCLGFRILLFNSVTV